MHNMSFGTDELMRMSCAQISCNSTFSKDFGSEPIAVHFESSLIESLHYQEVKKAEVASKYI